MNTVFYNGKTIMMFKYLELLQIVTVEGLQNGYDITPESKNYLGYRNEFDLNKDVIIDFCKFVPLYRMYFPGIKKPP